MKSKPRWGNRMCGGGPIGAALWPRQRAGRCALPLPLPLLAFKTSKAQPSGGFASASGGLPHPAPPYPWPRSSSQFQSCLHCLPGAFRVEGQPRWPARRKPGVFLEGISMKACTRPSYERVYEKDRA